MSRLAAGLATGVVLSLIAVPFADMAFAQDRQGRQRSGPAAAPRSAPAPTMRSAPSMRQAPVVRQAPVMRQAPMQAAPRMAPPRAQPRFAAPQRSGPTIQRSMPAARVERRDMRIQRQQAQQPARVQQRMQTQRELRDLRRTERALQRQQAVTPRAVQQNTERLQNLQSRRGRLTRIEQRELRQLRRAERQQGPQQAIQANPQRLQQLQQQRQRSRLTREERRELRNLRRAERQQGLQGPQQQAIQTNPQRLQQLQQQRQRGQLSREERRELRQLRRAERQQFGIGGGPRAAQRAFAEGRFASNFRARHDRHSARWAARHAWRLGLLASYVPWYGPIYWPYAYDDIFYYTFWPTAYEPGYWAYVYDDFFDGVFFPYGAPYVEYEYAGPYAPYARGTTGTAPSRGTPSRSARPARDACAEQANSITAWPFDQIAQTVQLNDEQHRLLEDLKKASAEAAARFKEACPDNVPMTPPGRLQAMIMRLQATLDAVKTVRPAMEAFYNALSDEQKARFNEIGPRIAQQRQRAPGAQQTAQAACSGDKVGLSSLPIDQIENVVQPTDAQADALDRLDEALQKAVDTLNQVCPTTIPQTPVGRLEVMEQRLEAMIAAANTVRPALDDFYAALSSEQKAKFNRLGRDTAQAGR
jgi:hypothetical protein